VKRTKQAPPAAERMTIELEVEGERVVRSSVRRPPARGRQLELLPPVGELAGDEAVLAVSEAATLRFEPAPSTPAPPLMVKTSFSASFSFSEMLRRFVAARLPAGPDARHAWIEATLAAAIAERCGQPWVDGVLADLGVGR